MNLRRAVFPVAGYGTRFLPASKAIPKELLPIVDKPAVQYVVEEAMAAGVETAIFVTAEGKSAIEDHFDRNLRLEAFLAERGKHDLLEVVRHVGSMVQVVAVRQKEALGLGHAVLQAAPVLGDEPFAVLLGDDIIVGQPPAIARLAELASADRRPGDRGDGSGPRRDPALRLRGRRPGRTRGVAGTRPGREACARERSVQPGDHRPLRPDPDVSSGRWRRRLPTGRARSSSPRGCAVPWPQDPVRLHLSG